MIVPRFPPKGNCGTSLTPWPGTVDNLAAFSGPSPRLCGERMGEGIPPCAAGVSMLD
jgi:hypothetical protein